MAVRNGRFQTASENVQLSILGEGNTSSLTQEITFPGLYWTINFIAGTHLSLAFSSMYNQTLLPTVSFCVCQARKNLGTT